jgi:hypothetical protein
MSIVAQCLFWWLILNGVVCLGLVLARLFAARGQSREEPPDWRLG